MINYSIVKRSVNANLIEINQAKSRINQAKKEGKTPQPADLALVKTEKQNAFAVAQYTGVMNIDKFSRHISSHGSVYSRADIAAILYLTVDCMREQLLEGKKSSTPEGAEALRRVCHKVSPLQFLGTDYTDFLKRDDNRFTYISTINPCNPCLIYILRSL